MQNREKQVPITKRHSQIEFPDDLSQCDIELILEQSENEQATKKAEIEGFTKAYLEAKQLVAELKDGASISPSQLEGHVLKWAESIDKRNKKGYRTIEIVVAKGSRVLSAEQVPRVMKMFTKGFTKFFDQEDDGRMTPTEFYKEFKEIHPFENGNGHVGHLVWALAISRENDRWPEKLPPNFS